MTVFFSMKLTAKKLALWGITAALYAAITLSTASFAYGPVQFRVAEALCVLCCFSPHMTVGLTLGCLVANLFSTVSVLDIAVGTAATLCACLWMSKIKTAFWMIWPNVVMNALFVGTMLAWVLTPTAFWQGFAVNALQVGFGELAVMSLLGVPLFLFVRKNARLRELLQ